MSIIILFINSASQSYCVYILKFAIIEVVILLYTIMFYCILYRTMYTYNVRCINSKTMCVI